MSKEYDLIIYTDGGRTPKEIITSWWISKAENNLIANKVLDGITSNTAEYQAIYDALVYGHKRGAKKILVKSDSLLVVNQLKGDWRVNYEHLEGLRQKVYDFINSTNLFVRFKWINRNKNPAGRLIEQYLNKR